MGAVGAHSLGGPGRRSILEGIGMDSRLGQGRQSLQRKAADPSTFGTHMCEEPGTTAKVEATGGVHRPGELLKAWQSVAM